MAGSIHKSIASNNVLCSITLGRAKKFNRHEIIFKWIKTELLELVKLHQLHTLTVKTIKKRNKKT